MADKSYITKHGDGSYSVRTSIWSPPGDHPVGWSMNLDVKDGKVVGVEPDTKNPITNGRLNVRYLALPEVVNSPERIRYPIKRAHEDRGKDKWERITWDEAYDMIEAKIRDITKNHGAECMLTLTGTGRESTLYAPVYGPAVMGTCNGQSTYAFSGLSCYGPRSTISNYILGAGYPEMDYAAYFPDRYDDPRYEIPKYILIWGKDPIYSNPDGLFGHAVVDLMKRGSKLIVIDPRVTWCAARAEYHLQLRPGTDTAVGMGLIRTIIEEDLYDHDFVEKWCYGFDELRKAVADYTPEKVEEISWVPAEKLVAAARAFATSRPSTALWGVAFDQMKNGVQAGMTFLDLIAICGYLDVPGGITLAKPTSFLGKWRYGMNDAISDEMKAKRIKDKQGRYKMYNAGGAMAGVLGDTLLDYLENMENEDYPILMSWWIGTNPIACMGHQPKRWKDALNKIEFNVANDLFMTPSIMACCDLVLPLATGAEHDGIVTPHMGRNTHMICAMNKAVDPGETKSDLEILIDMGKRMRPDLWDQYDNVEDFFTKQMHTVYDYGFEELQEKVIVQQPFEYRKYEKGMLSDDGQPGFDTPTGKVELSSFVFEAFDEKGVPWYEEPDFGPNTISDEDKERFPLIWTSGGRNPNMFHSEDRQIPTLRQITPWPKVTIHPKTAAKYGITEGDWVKITGFFGTCVQKAQIRPTVDPRVIHMEHGWWFPEQDGEAPNLFGTFKANPNNMVPHEDIGSTGYGAPYKNGVCNITKVRGLDDGDN